MHAVHLAALRHFRSARRETACVKECHGSHGLVNSAVTTLIYGSLLDLFSAFSILCKFGAVVSLWEFASSVK